jgi:hypothetical protein
MRKATKTVATWFGLAAGGAGIEHGIFEILQGDVRPGGLMIASIGPPCVPEEVWNACEPAMTVIPNFLVTGLLAVVIGLLILIGSAAFVGSKHGGMVLMLLSAALLLFGGGLFPPLIGLVGGLAGLKVNKPLNRKPPGPILCAGAHLWPWPLVAFLAWVIGQWPVGYFFNDFMRQAMYFGMLLIVVTLPLSVYSAYARDVRSVIDGG